MPAPTSGCLFSTVKNVSGSTKRFGFLPPHGRELANNEELTVFGSIWEAVGRGDYSASKRNHDALATAIRDGDLELKESPCVVLYDETDEASYRLTVDSSTLAAAAPAWGS